MDEPESDGRKKGASGECGQRRHGTQTAVRRPTVCGCMGWFHGVSGVETILTQRPSGRPPEASSSTDDVRVEVEIAPSSRGKSKVARELLENLTEA
ncbi:hypothetical protein ASA1KI_04600 [Opitutales bacterium ASA1]|nr:hypothetical protein ASA1KI_04600 [Opitutales bacterium ASA1]